jgi:hypothetical protein
MSGEQPGGEHGQPAAGDRSSGMVQVLATEHWSQLATRQLAYTESLSRVSMFLSVLSASVVSMALLAQVDQFHQAFDVAAVLILSVVLFVGIATVGRLSALNRDDARCVLAMNRLRHAYIEMYPELLPYFMAGTHDDGRGAMMTLGILRMPGERPMLDFLHGFQTLPAMVGVIVAVVAGSWAALIVRSLGLPMAAGVAVGIVVFLASTITMWLLARRNFIVFINSQRPAFPTPTGEGSEVPSA